MPNIIRFPGSQRRLRPATYFVWSPEGYVEVDRNVIDRMLPVFQGEDHPYPQHWYDTVKAARARDCHRCVLNWSHRGPFDVHHRTYDRFGNELLSDVYTLCRTCHQIHHGLKRMAA